MEAGVGLPCGVVLLIPHQLPHINSKFRVADTKLAIGHGADRHDAFV